MRQSLRLKIFLAIFSSISFIYIVAFTIVLLQVRSIFTQNLTNETRNLVKSTSLYFNSVFDKDIELIRVVKNTLISLSDEEFNTLVKKQDKIVKEILPETPQFLSMGISWELTYIDPNYKSTHGRYRYLYYWSEGNIVEKIDTMDVQEDAIGSLYYFFKISKKEDITDIYYDSYTGMIEDQQLMNSIGIPLLKNNKYIGLVVADISLERMNTVIEKVKPVSVAHTFLVSHTGNIVANSTGEFINESFVKIMPVDAIKRNLALKIQNGESVFFFQKDSLGHKNFVLFEPFYFGGINRAWSIGVIVPLEVIQKDSNKLLYTVAIIAIIGLLIIIFVTYFIVDSLIIPINNAVKSLANISRFDISEAQKITSKRTDELGKIGDSINELVDALNEIKTFTFEISKGNLEVSYKPKSNKDTLGQAILEMQRSLKIAKIEEEKRGQDEKVLSWSVQGESKVSEILRENSQDLTKLSYEVISYLVKYTDAAQGALFMVNHNSREIELLSAYAYERRKFFHKSIPFGVGLIGRSVQENEIIYITDIPEGYANISSGLGEQEPRSILIVPFKFNEITYAVVELNTFADFKVYARKFIEKIGVSVASTIANLQITRETNTLVNELKARTQDLSAQQEEMRQNFEEMQATQDELKRKASEFENIVNALNQVSYVVVYDMNRRIIDINQNFLSLLKRAKDQMLGTIQGAFIADEEQKRNLDILWSNIEAGRISRFIQKVDIDGRILTFNEAYIPIFDDSGKPYKVINISNDITNINIK